MACGPANATLDEQFNIAGLFSGISGTAEIRFGTALLDMEFKAVATDDDNNIYLGGFVASLPSRFLAYKLTATGLPVWSTALPALSSGSKDEANGIAVDQSGCVYLGGFTESLAADSDFAAAKLSNSGTLIWMTAVPSFEALSIDQARGITVDSQGNVYLGGFSEPNGFPSQFAAVKLDNAGQLIWATALTAFSSGSFDQANSIAIDESGSIFLAGSTDPVGPILQQFAATKLNNSGAVIWRNTGSFLSSGVLSQANGVAVDQDGNAYVGGEAGVFAAAKLDGVSGILLWTSALPSLSGGSTDRAFAITLDDAACIYLGGEMQIGFGSQFAAAKLDIDGSVVWTFIVPTFGSTMSGESAFGVAVDTAQAVILAGRTDSFSFGGVAKLLQQSVVPSGVLRSLVALPFIPMAAA